MREKIINNKVLTITISIVVVFAVILTLRYTLSTRNNTSPSIYTRDELSDKINRLENLHTGEDGFIEGERISKIALYYEGALVTSLDNSKIYEVYDYSCTNGVVPSWNPRSNSLVLTPSTTQTNCSVYVKDVDNFYSKILADNVEQSDENLDFSTINGNGLYYTSDLTRGEDNTRVYYFRGDVDNNWVYFGGYYWRIVRTNSEYGVKLIYSGDASATDSAYIAQATKYGPYETTKNSNNNNPTLYGLSQYYLGYSYSSTDFSTLPQTNSTIKNLVENWYTTHLSSESNYLSTTAIYCNAKQQFTYTKYEYEYYANGNTSYPDAKSARRIYSSDALTRIGTNYKPTFSCLTENNSRYTMSSNTGNALLSKPLALITADEVAYGGMTLLTNNPNNYLRDNANQTWWTMTPYNYQYVRPVFADGTTSLEGFSFKYRYWTLGFSVNQKLIGSFTSGSITSTTTNTFGMLTSNSGAWVRPVTSVKACVVVTEGNGTKATPYMLSDSQC